MGTMAERLFRELCETFWSWHAQGFRAGREVVGCGEEGVDIAGLSGSEADDFATIIDTGGEDQIKRRVGGGQRVEIGHQAVAPKERARVALAVDGDADDFTAVVGADGSAVPEIPILVQAKREAGKL
jgi:hypothetical protein